MGSVVVRGKDAPTLRSTRVMVALARAASAPVDALPNFRVASLHACNKPDDVIKENGRA